MNPILWAELDGQVEAMSSTFRISSSDPMRRRDESVNWKESFYCNFVLQSFCHL